MVNCSMNMFGTIQQSPSFVLCQKTLELLVLTIDSDT